MKTLNEMKISKNALLTELEANDLVGGYIQVYGSNTHYSGSLNPQRLLTAVDGEIIGQDGFSGSLYGDRWESINHDCPPVGEATISVASAS